MEIEDLQAEVLRQHRIWRGFESTFKRLDPKAVEESLSGVLKWLEEWLARQGIFFNDKGRCKPFSAVSTDTVGAWDIMFRYRLHTVFRVALETYRRYGYDAALRVLNRSALVVCALMDSRHQAVAAHALASFSGWVGTKVSLKKNKRLNVALRMCDPRRPFSALLERLPVPVTLSWGDMKKESPGTQGTAPGEKKRKDRLARLVSRATKHLEAELKQEHDRFTPIGKAPGPVDNDFSLRAQAKLDFETAKRKARLSRKESLAIAAWLSGLTEAEVAQQLEVRQGTASALISRARKKIRKAAGFL